MTDGISQTAQDVNKVHQQVVQTHRSAESFNRQAATSSLWGLRAKCGWENWDKEGARPITEKTLLAAHSFIQQLPIALPSPSVHPEPDGQIELEWYVSPSYLLSVSIDSNGPISWAAKFGSETTRGQAQFKDLIPPTVIYLIGKVFTS